MSGINPLAVELGTHKSAERLLVRLAAIKGVGMDRGLSDRWVGEDRMDIIQGQRCGGFVVFTDQDRLRHAIRLGAVLCLSDADDAQDSTVMQLPGGRSVLIQAPLERVLGWF